MSEQEKRDDLVLEMAQQLCECAGISCQNCPKAHSPEEYGECELPEICNTLADYVLRKEEEVRKETAEKIYSEINKLADECMVERRKPIFKFDGTIFNYVKFFNWLKSFIKEFGVKEEDDDKRKGSKNTFAKQR